ETGLRAALRQAQAPDDSQHLGKGDGTVSDISVADDAVLALARRLDEVCNRFERGWRSGPQPQIEDFLSETPEPDRSTLLRELVLLDVYYHQRKGEVPPWEEYRRRFPTFDASWLTEMDAEVSAPACGERFGDYALLEEIGRG